MQENLNEYDYKNNLFKYIIITQLIPFINQLIQPEFKEINFDLMTQKKKLLKQLILWF